MKYKRVAITKIKANGGRIRKKISRIDELAESMAAIGLVNAITVSKNMTLLAGRRRLNAAKQLGWKTIDVRVDDT